VEEGRKESQYLDASALHNTPGTIIHLLKHCHSGINFAVNNQPT
jgi:hypothetical protein